MTSRYIGTIASVPGNDGFGFIGLASVTLEDGTQHNLETRSDIFIHQDECNANLAPGMTFSFEVVPDQKRGSGTFRASACREISVLVAKLVPDENESILPGFPVNMEISPDLLVTASDLDIHRRMKNVPGEVVAKVIANTPLAGIPRTVRLDLSMDQMKELLNRVLARLFPDMLQLLGDVSPDVDKNEWDRLIEEQTEVLRTMDMEGQIVELRRAYDRFCGTAKVLGWLGEKGLFRPDTIIPIQCLPDFFMACPVWFQHFGLEGELNLANRAWEGQDPQVHPATQYFCDLFPNQVWMDVFQMFNRRPRSLKRYRGDQIPPHVLGILSQATQVMERVVIATPYHDIAGQDWQDLSWIRAIDPYVLGFVSGIPFFFVLGRFSNTGVFPLFNELVGDTIEFLRQNKEKLAGFNTVVHPYWYEGKSGPSFRERQLGADLIVRVNELIAAFEAGNLFDWLRG